MGAALDAFILRVEDDLTALGDEGCEALAHYLLDEINSDTEGSDMASIFPIIITEVEVVEIGTIEDGRRTMGSDNQRLEIRLRSRETGDSESILLLGEKLEVKLAQPSNLGALKSE